MTFFPAFRALFAVMLLLVTGGRGDLLGGGGARLLVEQETEPLSASASNASRNFVARYNLSDVQAKELDTLLWNVSQECIQVPVRLQLDYLYTMLAYAEVASAFRALPDAPDVSLLFPDTSDEVTSTTVFRSNLSYTGRGDAWITDATTAPCKSGDCRGRGAGSRLADGSPAQSTDDLQGLPRDLDTDASPQDMVPGSEELPRPQLLTYYRYDLFSQLGLTPPSTWADLASWAAAVNGTVDADGDGEYDWALCLDLMPACKSGFLVMAMMASAVQPETPYGTFFQPEDMKPLVSSSAFVEALRLLRRLADYSLPGGSDPMACRAFEPAFFQGKCLLTISFDQMRAATATATATAANSASTGTSAASEAAVAAVGGSGGSASSRGILPADALGVAALPGSEVLLDRATGALVSCGQSNCPNAVNTTCATQGDHRLPRPCLVNRAPLVATLEHETVVADYMSAAQQQQLAAMESQLAASRRTWGEALASSLLLDNDTAAAAAAGTWATDSGVVAGLQGGAGGEGSPPAASQQQQRRRRRRQLAGLQRAARRQAERRQLAVGDWTSVEPLTQLGYSASEASRFLSAYWGSLLGEDAGADAPGPNRNVVLELQIRGSSFFTNIFSQAVVWVLRDGLSPDQAARWAAEDTEGLLRQVAANRTRLAYKYCQDIGWNGDHRLPHSPITDDDDDGGRLSAGELTAVIVAPICGVSLAVAAVAVAVCVLRRRGGSLHRTVGPPGPGLGTTLILTDIQNSTVLWESLPADTMDAAIRCHHEVLQGLLQGHRGYESATEGDAFILAFHTAADAARYAVAAQELLVAAPWPSEMLSHPDCEVVWVAPQRSDPIASLSYINRELRSAITRAVQPGAAPHAPHGADGAAGAGAGAAAAGEPRPAGPLLGRLWPPCCRRGVGGRGSSSTGAGAGGEGEGSDGGGGEGKGGGGGGGGSGKGRASDHGGSSHGGGGGGGRAVELSTAPSGHGSFSQQADAAVGRITRANSYRSGKSKNRLMLSVGSDNAGGERPPSCHHLLHLSPLAKCPSDIRSYMTDNEADVEFSLQKDSARVVFDCNGVPLPAGAAGAHGSGRAAAGAGGAGGHSPRGGSRLQHTSGLGLGLGLEGSVDVATQLDSPAAAAASGGFGSVASGGGSGGHSVAGSMLALGINVSVSTLTEALRQGWRKVAPPGGGGGAGGGGSTNSASMDAGSDSGPVGVAPAVGPEPRLAFRGMRVRMGMHTGADLSEVSLNKATGRTQYSGTFMTAAKHVCDAAHGGQVVLSPATFKRLPPGFLAKSAFLIHMGDHLLADGEEPEALYQLLPYSLSCRLPFFAPLRTHEYVALGLPDAPVGRVTVVFMYVIGAQTLLAWNPMVAGDALSIFQDTVSEQLTGTDGYVVELVDGLCLAAFRSAADALLWSLRCGRLLLSAPWSDELLEHELCEEVSLLLLGDCAAGPAPSMRAPPAPQGMAAAALLNGGQHQHQRCFTLPRASAIRHKTLMRGLRLKVGMDTGFVAESINATTGRMAYRGRPMNRAARIASKALAGQVHCSAAVWGSGSERLGVLARSGGEDEVTASSLGLQSLKGVMEKIEVLSVSYKGNVLSAEEAAVVAKRAPRQSTSSSCGGSNVPTVLSGLVSAFSLGHGATLSGGGGGGGGGGGCAPHLPACRSSTAIDPSRFSSGGLQPTTTTITTTAADRLSPDTSILRHSPTTMPLPIHGSVGFKDICARSDTTSAASSAPLSANTRFSVDGAATLTRLRLVTSSSAASPKAEPSLPQDGPPAASEANSGSSAFAAAAAAAASDSRRRWAAAAELSELPAAAAAAAAAVGLEAAAPGDSASRRSSDLQAVVRSDLIVVHLNPLHDDMDKADSPTARGSNSSRGRATIPPQPQVAAAAAATGAVVPEPRDVPASRSHGSGGAAGAAFLPFGCQRNESPAAATAPVSSNQPSGDSSNQPSGDSSDGGAPAGSQASPVASSIPSPTTSDLQRAATFGRGGDGSFIGLLPLPPPPPPLPPPQPIGQSAASAGRGAGAENL